MSQPWNMKNVVLYSLGGIGVTFVAVIALIRSRKARTWGYYKNKQSLKDKTYVITGGNTGIGFEVARSLARNEANVILACRDVQRGRRAADAIKHETQNNNVFTLRLDLASLESVHTFSEQFKTSFACLDGLVCNAGVWIDMRHQMRTQDGFEIHFGTNYLGHFLLTDLLLPCLNDAKSARIVMVSSELMLQGQCNLQALDFVREGRVARVESHVPTGYADSKLMIALLCRELAISLPRNVTTVVTSPGFCYTELFRHSGLSWWRMLLALPIFAMFMRPASRGAMNINFCLLEPNLQSGNFYTDCKLGGKENAKIDEFQAQGLPFMRLSHGLVERFRQ